MNTIAVDIGNSATKVSVATDTPLISVGDDLDQVLEEVPAKASRWVIVSVDSQKTLLWSSWIRQHRPTDEISVVDNDQIPLSSSVKDRSAVGADRLMAAYAATQLHHAPACPIVVVDAGTAVTIDLVNVVNPKDVTRNIAKEGDDQKRPAEGWGGDYVFCGGLIFPGLTADLKSLSRVTAALPDFTRSELPAVQKNVTIGDDTASAVLNGVVQSHAWAIISIAQAMARHHDAAVFCTGGGIVHVGQLTPDHWRFVPDLIHQGCRQMFPSY
jgi:pantothenate kinase type III